MNRISLFGQINLSRVNIFNLIKRESIRIIFTVQSADGTTRKINVNPIKIQDRTFIF